MVGGTNATHCLYVNINSSIPQFGQAYPLPQDSKSIAGGFYEAGENPMTRKSCWPRAWWVKSRSQELTRLSNLFYATPTLSVRAVSVLT